MPNCLWPEIVTLTNILPSIRLVYDLHFRNSFLDFGVELVGREAHGRDVVRPARQLICGGDHHLVQGAEAVVNVHHGQAGVGLQVASVLPTLQGIVENGHSVV